MQYCILILVSKTAETCLYLTEKTLLTIVQVTPSVQQLTNELPRFQFLRQKPRLQSVVSIMSYS